MASNENAVTTASGATVTMEKIVNLSKRRGFVFPSSEIYGGLGSCWDYGPLGVELKRNVKDCLLYTSPSPRDGLLSRMPSSA